MAATCCYSGNFSCESGVVSICLCVCVCGSIEPLGLGSGIWASPGCSPWDLWRNWAWSPAGSSAGWWTQWFHGSEKRNSDTVLHRRAPPPNKSQRFNISSSCDKNKEVQLQQLKLFMFTSDLYILIKISQLENNLVELILHQLSELTSSNAAHLQAANRLFLRKWGGLWM